MSVSEQSKNKIGSSMNSSHVATTTSFDDEAVVIQRRENLIFPLFSEMSQIVKLPSVIYFISHFIAMFQFLTAGLWTNSYLFWGQYPEGYTQMHVFQYFIDCSLHTFQADNSDVSYIILLILFMIILFWHVFVIVYYHLFRQFNKMMLYTTQIIQMVIIPPFLPCYASHAGHAFSLVAETAISPEGISVKDAVLFVFMVISLAFLFVLFLISFSFTCKSPVLFQSFDAAWDEKPFLIILFLTCYSSFFGYVLYHFSAWNMVIFILISAGIGIYVIIQLKDFPFLHFWVNPLVAGLVVAHVGFELLLLPHAFDQGLSQYIFIPLTVAMMIIAIITAYILLTRKKKRIINTLSYCSLGEQKVTDANKRNHFESIQLKTANDIYSFLRIGIENNCDLYLDFSFSHFVIDNYATKDLVLSVAHMLSFFPSELQYFAYCLSAIGKFGKLSFQDHFLYFQMKKVHLMRQSSLSKEAAGMIRKIRKQSKDTISAIRGFWKEISNEHAKLDFNSLIAIRNTTNKVNGEFQDLTERFSNNQEMYDEYATFLIEAAGDYQEAAKWKSKAHLLELGRRLDTDFALKSLVNAYPHYLMNRIIDTHGNFIRGNVDATSGSTFSNDTTNNTTCANTQKVEEMSTNFITESKLRVSMQNALRHTSLPGLKATKGIFLFQLVVTILIFVIILMILPPINNDINKTIEELAQVTSLYTCIEYTAFLSGYIAITGSIFNKFGGYQTVFEKTHFPQSEVQKKQLGLFNNTYLHLDEFVKAGFRSMTTLMASLMEHPNQREEVISHLLDEEFVMKYISNLVVLPKFNTTKSVKDVMFESFYFMLKALREWKHDQHDTIPNLDLLLTGLHNMLNVIPKAEQIQDSLSNDGSMYINSKNKIFKLMETLIPVIFGVVLLAIQIKYVYLLYKKTKISLQILGKVKPDTIEASLLPICVHSKEKKINTGSSQLRTKANLSYMIIPLFTVFAVSVNAIMLFLPFNLATAQIEDVGSLFKWYILSSRRLGAILQTLTAFSYVSVQRTDETMKFLQESIEAIEKRHSDILGGNSDIPRLIGFDDDIDHNHFIDTCNHPPMQFYEFYMCLSTDRAVNQIQISINQLNKTVDDSSTFSLNVVHFCDALVLVDYKLAQQMFDFQDNLVEYANDQFLGITQIMLITSILGMAIALILLIFSFLLIHTFDTGLEGIRQMIRLLPPSMVMKNRSIMEFVIGNTASSNEEMLTPAQSIVQASSNAAVSISLDYTINSVNPSFRYITGLAPDEVLGQSLAILFPFPHGSSSSSSSENSSLQVLYEKLEEMKNIDRISNEENSCSLNMKCINEIGKPLHVQVTLIAIQNDNKKTESFVLVMRDMAAEKQQEIVAKNMKKRSEKILENLIPKQVFDALQKNNDSDGSTHFVSNSATVIFVQISGLLECVNSLSPSQMVVVVSKIYETFDEVAARYPAVHTMSGNEDLLVACCGIFDFMDQPKDQVAQAVMFAMEFNSLIDELNEQLVVELSFRTGINYGGPLAGSILSPEIPTFDLLGDVVRAASRLATDGLQGMVQITEAVMMLLDRNDYVLEKGKSIEGKEPNQSEQSYILKEIIIHQ